MTDPLHGSAGGPAPAWQPAAGWAPSGAGWPPPSPGAGGYPPPGVPAASDRRSKLPYVISVVLVVLGLAGAAISVVSMIAATGDPTSDHQFAEGAVTTVHLEAGQSKVVYVADTTGSATGTCAIKKPGHLTTYGHGLTINQWRAVYTLTGDTAGDYSLVCTGSSPRYSVGTDGSASISGIVAGMFGGVAVAAVGGAVALVTAIRRRKPAPAVYSY